MYKDTDSLKLDWASSYPYIVSHDDALCFYDMMQSKKQINRMFGMRIKEGSNKNANSQT